MLRNLVRRDVIRRHDSLRQYECERPTTGGAATYRLRPCHSAACGRTTTPRRLRPLWGTSQWASWRLGQVGTAVVPFVPWR